MSGTARPEPVEGSFSSADLKAFDRSLELAEAARDLPLDLLQEQQHRRAEDGRHVRAKEVPRIVDIVDVLQVTHLPLNLPSCYRFVGGSTGYRGYSVAETSTSRRITE